MVPILDVIYEPIRPAIIIEINVGENSKMIDWRAVKPIKYLGIIGLFKFKAVCMVTTAPMKNDKKALLNKTVVLMEVKKALNDLNDLIINDESIVNDNVDIYPFEKSLDEMITDFIQYIEQLEER